MLRISSFALICLFTASAFAQDTNSAIADLLQRAEAAIHAKHISEGAGLLSREIPFVGEDDRPRFEYDLACAQALMGDTSAAFDTLGRAVEDGYIDRQYVEADTDLVSLHTDPRWQPVLERMTALSKEQDARWNESGLATPYATNISDADKLAGLAELWAQAKFGFANFWHVPQLNWDQSYRDFIPKVLATHSTEEYYRVLQSFYALLEDGHTGVWRLGDMSILPLHTRLVDGHLLVIGSYASDADLQSLRAGDEIVTINSEPAVAWAEHNVAPFVSASTVQWRNAETYDRLLFEGPIGTSFTLGTRTPSGQQATRRFTIRTKYIWKSRPGFALKSLPGNIAYVAINNFGDDIANEWDKHWPEISKANALILDLRENSGGSSPMGYHVLATLIDKPTLAALSRSTRWIATYRAYGQAIMPRQFSIYSVEPDPARHFSGPVVMLISGRTFSAGEDTAVVFVQSHRGKVIGEPSGGSTGMPIEFDLPGGGKARVCTKHDSFADGREFIGVGIQPDIPVHITRDDIISGRDPVLETAIHTLQTTH